MVKHVNCQGKWLTCKLFREIVNMYTVKGNSKHMY